MTSQTYETKNTYSSQDAYTVHGLLTPEFIDLGCKVEEVGQMMLVTRKDQLCLLFDSVTSFTSQLASRVLKNKDLARIMFKRAGLSVAEGYVYRNREKEVARKRLTAIGPAVIKPADGSKGRGVSVNVTAETFDAAWSAAEEISSGKILVEKYFAKGEEARYLVIGETCVAVLKRIPPLVYGDGTSTIRQLVEQQNAYRETNPSTQGCLIEIDAHRTSIIRSQGYGLESIPPVGNKVIIDWKANISTGANSQNITDEVHASMKGLAERVARAVPGSDVVGVDILATDHSVEAREDNYIIVEANTRPGIGDHHYPVFGRPINVCKLVAEHCVRRMGFDVLATDEAPQTGRAADERSGRAGSGATLPLTAKRERANAVAGRSDTGSATAAFTLVLAGDTSLGDTYLKKTGIAEQMERLELNPASFFEALMPLISDKSYFIANLETVLAQAPRGPLDDMKGFLGWDKPDRTVATLKQIGVDAVSLGNNHTMDYGPDGLTETISHLVDAGIAVVGAGNNFDEASRALRIASPYGDIYVLAGFEFRTKYKDVYRFYAEEGRPGVHPFLQGDANQIARDINRIRARDPKAVIVAYPHWGGAANYQWANAAMFEENYSFIVAGADLVLGHGAHMLQQVVADEFGTTAFSLGNFVFNSPGRYKRNNAPPYSLICRLDLKRADDLWAGSLRLYPIVSDNRETGYRPRPVREAEAIEIYSLLDRHVEKGFREAFVLERDERGWYLARTTPLSPRFVAN